MAAVVRSVEMEAKNHKKSGTVFERLLINALLLVLAVITLYPFVWMTCSSLKTEGMILANPASLYIPKITFEAYKHIWERIPFLLFYRNSIIFAGGVTFLALMMDSVAGYAFARLRFKGRDALFLVILSTMMIPFQVIMIPLFVELNSVKLLDTFAALILPRASDAFGIFMMRSFFVSLPRDLEEAARIDGCNEFVIFRKIMLPLCKTAFVSLGLFIFNGNWGDLLFPMMMTSKDKMLTLQAGIAIMMGKQGVWEYSLMMASSMLTVLPILIAYLFLQKYFIQGIAMTGLKS